MIVNFKSLLLAALGSVTLATASLPVAAMPAATGLADDGSTLLLQVAEKNIDNGLRNWQMRRDGNRCRTWRDNCRNYHQGYYYQTPWWTLPLIIGGSIANQNHGSSHIQWCSSHYRSYNVRTDMWLGYDGLRHRCNSPY